MTQEISATATHSQDKESKMNKTVAEMTIPELVAKRDELASQYAVAVAMNTGNAESIKEWFDFLGKELVARMNSRITYTAGN